MASLAGRIYLFYIQDFRSSTIQRKANMEPRIPDVGEVLIHRFRRRPGEVRARVVSVDAERKIVQVKIGDKLYASLSSAASAVAGTRQNGWIYWGLKKQTAKGRRN